MAIRKIKILLALSAAAWGITGGLKNLADYEGAVGLTAFLLSVEGTESIRAIAFPLFTHLSFAFVWGSKFATGILCGMGSFKMWKCRAGPASAFLAAKDNVYLGIGISIFMLFFGFMVIIGTVFSPFEITELRTSYFQYATFQLAGLGMVMLFLALPEQDY